MKKKKKKRKERKKEKQFRVDSNNLGFICAVVSNVSGYKKYIK